MNFSRSPIFELRIMIIVSIVLIAGCSSDDNVVNNLNPAPIIPVVTAPADLSGIWEGTISQDTNSYDIALVFYYPPRAIEGRVMGIALRQGTEQPFVLIDAGYQDVTNDNLGYDYLVGKDGSHGTFMKVFEFDNNLVGVDRGSISLDLSGNTLTGTTTLDILGKFDTVLEYSLQNARDTTLADLIGSWSDSVYGWDDAAAGTSLTVNADGTVSALATGASSCTGSGLVVDIANYNIYLFDGAASNAGIALSTCGTRVFNAGTPLQTLEDVNGDYDGMGVVVEDDSGNDILVVILSSTLSKTPSMATYNEFIKN